MNIDLMNLLYITIIILFLILLINKNNIDTFLFDFNLEPKLCKQKCHDIPGDCLYQCFNTVMRWLTNITVRPIDKLCKECIIFSSVKTSKALVASSKINILGSR